MFRFAFKNMAVRWVKLLLVALSVVISAGVALISFNVSSQVREGIQTTAGYYDIIIGPSGSATQLAMNTMFFTDSPLGAISFDIAEQLQNSPQVNAVVPFTMGDSFNGARVIGSTPALLEGKRLETGEMFSDAFTCVLGAAVADKYALKPGDTLVTSHGLAEAGEKHEAQPFTVTGVLARTHTAYDNAVFTSYASVWKMHGIEAEEARAHEEEEDGEAHAHEGTVCAILVKTKSPGAYYALSEYYGKDASLLVINPATVLREVLSNVDLSSKIVYALCGVILVMNLFVICVITALCMYDAKKEIALMRLIGVSMGRIQLMYLIQNACAGLVSVALSLGVSMLGLSLMGGFVADMGIVLNNARVYPMEYAIMALVFALTVAPTFLLTWRMARRGGLDAR